MRKYFTLLYITFSVMSFAQFKDNVFDQDRPATNQQQNSPDTNTPTQTGAAEQSYTPTEMDQSTQSSASLVPDGGEHPEGPGNPGEPVPIDDYVPLLLFGALALIFYSQRKNKKINI